MCILKMGRYITEIEVGWQVKINKRNKSRRAASARVLNPRRMSPRDLPIDKTYY